MVAETGTKISCTKMSGRYVLLSHLIFLVTSMTAASKAKPKAPLHLLFSISLHYPVQPGYQSANTFHPDLLGTTWRLSQDHHCFLPRNLEEGVRPAQNAGKRRTYQRPPAPEGELLRLRRRS